MTFNKKFPWLVPTLSAVSLVSLGFGQIDLSSEIATRSTKGVSAMELLKQGDVAYNAENYSEAVESFKEALNIVPGGNKTRALRTELNERYATAAAQYAKRLRAIGKLDEARTLLEDAIILAPNNSFAKTQLEYLDDPVRTHGGAITHEHVKNVEKVRHLLYKGESALNLGKYDEGTDHYTAVLKIDPYNTAARRGLEKIESLRSAYYQSAKDHTKSLLISQVDEAWEIKPNALRPQDIGTIPLLDINKEVSAAAATLQEKLDNIILPVVDFRDIDVAEAVEILRVLTAKHDNTSLLNEDRGIQFINNIDAKSREGTTRFNLSMKNVPVRAVLKHMSSVLGVEYITDGYTVTMATAGTEAGILSVRSYVVNADFLNNASQGDLGTPSGSDPFGGAESNDPFTNGSSSASTTVGGRVNAKSVLESFGVTFGPGATAKFLPTSNKLIVKNNFTQHRKVSEIVDQLINDQPLMVSMEVAFIRVNNVTTDELATDVFLNGAITDALNDINSAYEISAPHASGSLTAGNRSGGLASVSNGFNNDASTAPAPGIASIVGTLNNGSAVELLVRGLKQKSSTDVLTKPSVVTLSGQQATVFVGREFIYPTEYDPPRIFNNVGGAVGLGLDDGIEDDFGDVVISPTSDFVLVFDENLNLIEAFINGQSFSNSLAGAGTPSTPTNFVTTNLGTEINVIPTLSADNKLINLDITGTVREFDGFLNYGTPLTSVSSTVGLADGVSADSLIASASGIPGVFVSTLSGDENDEFDTGATIVSGTGDVGALFGEIQQTSVTNEVSENAILQPIFETINIDTNVSVFDGHTIVLGGLIQSRPTKVQDETPILGRIPIVGNLFKSNVDADEKTHLLITVTPRVIDSTGRPINPDN